MAQGVYGVSIAAEHVFFICEASVLNGWMCHKLEVIKNENLF